MFVFAVGMDNSEYIGTGFLTISSAESVLCLFKMFSENFNEGGACNNKRRFI